LQHYRRVFNEELAKFPEKFHELVCAGGNTSQTGEATAG